MNRQTGWVKLKKKRMIERRYIRTERKETGREE